MYLLVQVWRPQFLKHFLLLYILTSVFQRALGRIKVAQSYHFFILTPHKTHHIYPEEKQGVSQAAYLKNQEPS